MASVVQTVCPGCHKMLRFPSDWVKVALRCKSCGTIVQVRQQPSSTPLAKPAAATAQASSAATRALLIGGILLVAVAAIGYLYGPQLWGPGSSWDLRNGTPPNGQAPVAGHHAQKSLLADDVFPRRLLII